MAAHTLKADLNKMYLLPEAAFKKWKAIDDDNKISTAINNEMRKILNKKNVKSNTQKWLQYRQQLARMMAYKRYLESKKEREEQNKKQKTHRPTLAQQSTSVHEPTAARQSTSAHEPTAAQQSTSTQPITPIQKRKTIRLPPPTAESEVQAVPEMFSQYTQTDKPWFDEGEVFENNPFEDRGFVNPDIGMSTRYMSTSTRNSVFPDISQPDVSMSPRSSMETARRLLGASEATGLSGQFVRDPSGQFLNFVPNEDVSLVNLEEMEKELLRPTGPNEKDYQIIENMTDDGVEVLTVPKVHLPHVNELLEDEWIDQRRESLVPPTQDRYWLRKRPRIITDETPIPLMKIIKRKRRTNPMNLFDQPHIDNFFPKTKRAQRGGANKIKWLRLP